MITVNVQVPLYDSASGSAGIKLTADSGAHSTVSVDFKKILSFANLASEDVVDFFIFSASVYGIDRFIERRKNSVDGWSRELKVNFPVSNPTKWKAIKTQVEVLLSFLTGDYWQVDFHKAKFIFPEQPLEDQYNETFSQVNLFSGGLDSLIGTLNFLKKNPSEKLMLISHYDPEMKGPKKDQEGLLAELLLKYPNCISYIPSTKVTLGKADNKETTFRARSILFIGMAVLVANSKNLDVIVPENGTVSLNYPLSASRRSACSTRTTHPYFLQLIRDIWCALGIQTKIDNPFEFQTKGEMTLPFEKDDFAKSLFLISNSCGKRRHDERRGNPSAKHCGVCMPCIYRRAALNLIGIDKDADYADKINDLIFKMKKGQDVGACLEYLKIPLTLNEVKNELIINGVKDLTKLKQYAEVVLRTRDELQELIKNVGNSTIKIKAGIT